MLRMFIFQCRNKQQYFARSRCLYLKAETQVRNTPNLPTNIVPTNIAGLKTFREIPYGPGNSTPFNLDYARVKPCEIYNVSREIGRILQALVPPAPTFGQHREARLSLFIFINIIAIIIIIPINLFSLLLLLLSYLSNSYYVIAVYES